MIVVLIKNDFLAKGIISCFLKSRDCWRHKKLW